MWPRNLKRNSDLRSKQLDSDQNRRKQGQFQPNLTISFAPGSGLRYVLYQSSLTSFITGLAETQIDPSPANKHFPEYTNSLIKKNFFSASHQNLNQPGEVLSELVSSEIPVAANQHMSRTQGCAPMQVNGWWGHKQWRSSEASRIRSRQACTRSLASRLETIGSGASPKGQKGQLLTSTIT